MVIIGDNILALVYLCRRGGDNLFWAVNFRILLPSFIGYLWASSLRLVDLIEAQSKQSSYKGTELNVFLLCASDCDVSVYSCKELCVASCS